MTTLHPHHAPLAQGNATPSLSLTHFHQENQIKYFIWLFSGSWNQGRCRSGGECCLHPPYYPWHCPGVTTSFQPWHLGCHQHGDTKAPGLTPNHKLTQNGSVERCSHSRMCCRWGLPSVCQGSQGALLDCLWLTCVRHLPLLASSSAGCPTPAGTWDEGLALAQAPPARAARGAAMGPGWDSPSPPHDPIVS